MDIMTLAARLTLDAGEYMSGVTTAEKAGKGLADKLDGHFKKIQKAAKAAISVVAIKKATQAVIGFADSVAAAGDKIDKQSQALGMSRKAYQEWDYILGQSGASIDSMGVSMKTLNSAILTGGRENKKAFNDLGIKLKDISDLSMEEQFAAVVKAFNKLPSSAQKSALAVKLFGRNGMELMPLLNSSAESIDELKKQAQDLGLIMSDEAVDASVKYGDAMDALKRTLTGFKNEIGARILPRLTTYIEKLTSFAGKLIDAYKKKGLSGVFTELSKSFDALVVKLKTSDSGVLQWLGNAIEKVKTAFEFVVSLINDFPATIAKLKESDSPVLELLGTALEGIQSVFQWIYDNKDAIAQAMLDIIDAVNNAWEAVSVWWSDFSADVEAVWGVLGTWFGTNVWTPISEFATAAWTTISQFFDDPMGTIQAAWGLLATWFDENVWTPIANYVNSAWDTISQIFSDPLGLIQGAWNTVATWFDTNVWTPIKNAVNDAWTAVSDFFGTTILGSLQAAWNGVVEFFQPIIEVFNKIKEAVSSAYEWVTKMLGLNGQSSSTTSSHTHTNTTINRVYTDENGGLVTEYADGSEDVEGGAGHKFAKGSWNVPHDMIARLHAGEMVLTKSQARRYRDEQTPDYGSIGGMVASAVQDAMQSVYVMLNGDKVGDLTTKRINKNINAGTYSKLRAMGG